jgi:hypothetical protein
VVCFEYMLRASYLVCTHMWISIGALLVVEKACFSPDRLGEFVVVVISLEKPVKEDRLMRSAKKGMVFLGNVRLGLQSNDVSPIKATEIYLQVVGE